MKMEIRKVEEINKENTVLVCMPYGHDGIPGSLPGECGLCGRKIIYAPSALDIKKWCMNCAIEQIKEIEGEGFKVQLTDRMVEEMKEFFKEKHNDADDAKGP